MKSHKYEHDTFHATLSLTLYHEVQVSWSMRVENEVKFRGEERQEWSGISTL